MRSRQHADLAAFLALHCRCNKMNARFADVSRFIGPIKNKIDFIF